MTKEEMIKALVKEKEHYKGKLSTRLMKVAALKALIVNVDKEINWLSHLIRKGE